MAYLQAPMPIDRKELGSNYLREQQWPEGLVTSFMKNLDHVAYRFMIVDDSGSMSVSDGQMLMRHGNKGKFVNCTRWKELEQGIKFHADFAEIAQAPTEFRLLNGAPPIVVGESTDDDGMGKKTLLKALERGPNGATPLCRQVREIANKIKLMASELRQRGQIASVTIFTDGQASDGNMATALRELQHLPVWTVIRLCTNEDSVGEYWSQVDDDIELPMDVLDDLRGEAKEVRKNNPALNYCMQLHQFRENGVHMKVFDFLDEKKLMPNELNSLIATVLGGKESDYCHPDVDIGQFLADVTQANNRSSKVYDPLTNKETTIINVTGLKRQCRKGGGCTIA